MGHLAFASWPAKPIFLSLLNRFKTQSSFSGTTKKPFNLSLLFLVSRVQI